MNPKTKVDVQDYLSVPGAEVIIQSPEDKSMRIEKLAHIIMRAAAQDPNRRVEFWIKIKE